MPPNLLALQNLLALNIPWFGASILSTGSSWGVLSPGQKEAPGLCRHDDRGRLRLQDSEFEP